MSWSSDDSVVSVIAAAGPASKSASGGRGRGTARDSQTTTPNKSIPEPSTKSPIPQPERKSTTTSKTPVSNQPATSSVPIPALQQLNKNLSTGVSQDRPQPNTAKPASVPSHANQPETNKLKQTPLQDNKNLTSGVSQDKPQPNTAKPTGSTLDAKQSETNKPNQTQQQDSKRSSTETKATADPTLPARVLRRRNRSRSAGKRDPTDSCKQTADPSSSEKLVEVEEQNIGLGSSESSTLENKSSETARDISNGDPVKDSSTRKEIMGNKLSSEKNKGGKDQDQDAKKKAKEAKKIAKARKSKSPTSDRESAVENRSSIETTDSYSSAATLVATANAAVGRRSPKKSPRSIPRSGVKLREAFSSDEESGLSAGFRTPQATTPVMKRATEHASPSQKLLEFGKNIEREIGKFTRRSPTTEKQNHGTDKFLAVHHHKRCSKDGAIETDSDSFAMFENSEQLYATAPKDYFPIDDNLSDDVFMSCIDLAANSPDIPSRSQNKNMASPASVKKFPASSEIKDGEPKQKMTLLQIAKQGSLQPPSKQVEVQESTSRTHTLPTKTKTPEEKSLSSNRRFHSESPKTAPAKAVSVAVGDGGKSNKPDEKVKLRHSPVVPRRFVVEDSRSPRTPKSPPSTPKSPASTPKSPTSTPKSPTSTPKSPTPTTSGQQKLNSGIAATDKQSPTRSTLDQQKSNSGISATDKRSPKTHRHNQKGSKSPSPLKRVQAKPLSPSPTAPRRFPAENYSPKIQKRIQAAPGSPVIPPHKSKDGSKSPAANRQMKSSAAISPSQKRKAEAPFLVKQSAMVVAPTSTSQDRKVEAPFPVEQNVTVVAQTSPSQKRKVEAPFPLKPSVVVVAQTSRDPVETTSNKCSKAEEESTQIQDSPKAPKQDKMLLEGPKKKGHLRSTYDNVPDSDDSMAYFIDKNDPIFFEDNCVSEEIIATEKTPLHYKVEEPKKLGIEIMQAPTKATIKCVQQEHDSAIRTVGAERVTTKTTIVTASQNAGQPKNVVTTSQNAGQSKTVVTTSQNAGQPKTVETMSQNAGQPKTVETTSQNAGQPKTVETTSQNASQPKTVVTTSQNAGQPKTVVTTSQIAGQPKTIITTSQNAGQPKTIITTSQNAGQPKTVVTTSQNAGQPKTVVTTSQNAGQPKTVGGIVKELVTASKSETTSATTVTISQKIVTPMVAVVSHQQNKSEQSSKLQARPCEPSVSTSRVVMRSDSTEPAVDTEAPKSIEKAESNAQTAEDTEHLTKRQIRRRNKKKQLQLTGKGSLDSSDGPLSPTLPSDGATGNDPRPLEDKTDCKEEAVEWVASSQKTQRTNDAPVPEHSVQSKDAKEHKTTDSKSPSVKQDSVKRDHVPPPSPSANEALGGIVEEDEDLEDYEDIFVDDKAREVLVFGESVLKRLSSLVESQGDSNDLETKFYPDFDETDDVITELHDSKKSCLEVLDEICDMGEKFKKEHESESESPSARGISDIKHEHSAKCDSDGKLNVQGLPAVQKRPSIPNELQLNSVENRSMFSTDYSVTEPKRDSQKLTEVIDSYGDDTITPTTVPRVDNFPRPNGSYMIPNRTNIVIQDDVNSRSSDEEFLSAERRFSTEALRVPAIEETFSELMSVKNILQEMEDKTPTSEPLLRFIGPSDLASPPSYLTGSGRRSRMSPSITERTESELDISEQLDNVSISTDSMYADDEDDGSEMIINKTYTEETGGECQVSYTFYNTAQGYDSDEFWEKNSAAEDNFQVLQEPATQASCTFKKARTEMHEIQRHLQDLKRQMNYLEDDVQGTSLSQSLSLGSSEWRPLSE